MLSDRARGLKTLVLAATHLLYDLASVGLGKAARISLSLLQGELIHLLVNEAVILLDKGRVIVVTNSAGPVLSINAGHQGRALGLQDLRVAGRLRVLHATCSHWHVWWWTHLRVQLKVVGLQHAVVSPRAVGSLALLLGQDVRDALTAALVLRVGANINILTTSPLLLRQITILLIV